MGETLSRHILSELFRQMIDHETEAAKFYAELALMCSFLPEVSDFWGAMSADELEHQETLQKLQQLATPTQLSRNVEVQLWDKVNQIGQILESDLISPISNLEDAYIIAKDLEASEINMVFEYLVNGSLLSGNESAAIIKNLMQHQFRLMSFNEVFGDKEKRLKISL